MPQEDPELFQVGRTYSRRQSVAVINISRKLAFRFSKFLSSSGNNDLFSVGIMLVGFVLRDGLSHGSRQLGNACLGLILGGLFLLLVLWLLFGDVGVVSIGVAFLVVGHRSRPKANNGKIAVASFARIVFRRRRRVIHHIARRSRTRRIQLHIGSSSSSSLEYATALPNLFFILEGTGRSRLVVDALAVRHGSSLTRGDLPCS